MPSRVSLASFRKQEIGRPRLVPPLRQHRRRRHEPEAWRCSRRCRWAWRSRRHRPGDAGEHVLVDFARQQVAVVERGLAEVGQQGVAGAVDANLVAALKLDGVKHGRTPRSCD